MIDHEHTAEQAKTNLFSTLAPADTLTLLFDGYYTTGSAVSSSQSLCKLLLYINGLIDDGARPSAVDQLHPIRCDDQDHLYLSASFLHVSTK